MTQMNRKLLLGTSIRLWGILVILFERSYYWCNLMSMQKLINVLALTSFVVVLTYTLARMIIDGINQVLNTQLKQSQKHF